MRLRLRAIATIACLLGSFCLRAHAQAVEPSEDATPAARSEDARLSTERAAALFAVGNYAAALVDYERAYELLEDHPRRFLTLYNIAACNERLIRYESALQYFERYLREGGARAADAPQVRTKVETLRNLLGSLTISSNVRSEVWVDDRHVGASPAQLMLPAGRHLIELRAVLHESARRDLVVRARGDHRLRFELAPLSNYRGLSPGYFIGSVAVTGVLLVTGAILGVSALGASSDGVALAERHMQLKSPALERAQAKVGRRAVWADLAVGGAALFGTTSLLLLLVTDWNGADRHTGSVGARGR